MSRDHDESGGLTAQITQITWIIEICMQWQRSQGEHADMAVEQKVEMRALMFRLGSNQDSRPPDLVMPMRVLSSLPYLPKVMALKGELSCVVDISCCPLYTRNSPAESNSSQSKAP